jgi:hypothetical protein
MNERIKELQNQCIIKDKGTVLDLDVEKFAELIIRECAAEADRHTIYCRGIQWSRWIREHFGIEE